MSSSRKPAQSNFALALIDTAKLWLIKVMEAHSEPPASLLGSLAGKMPFANTFISTERPQNVELAALRHNLKHLSTNLQNGKPEKEKEYLDRLKSKYGQIITLSEFRQQIGFLLQFYDTLNKLALEFVDYNSYSLKFSFENEPRNRIITALQDHIRTNTAATDATALRPALLDAALRRGKSEFEAQEKHLKAVASEKRLREIDDAHERVINQPHESNRPTLALSPVAPPKRNLVRSNNPFDEDEPCQEIQQSILEEQTTLARYQEATKDYCIHLLGQILNELEAAYYDDKDHALFKLLSPRESNERKKIATKLLTSYFNEMLSQQKIQTDIDSAIAQLKPSFHQAWEKYKIMVQLKQSTSVAAFHQVLNAADNKKILTRRRDTYFDTFVKACGLVVATILGLPLGLVGGAYLGYTCLFGKRATHGSIFLNTIEDLRKEAAPKPC